ncbi:hypothetical protein V8E36_005627 [Tilletia maclaganii]
MHSTAACVRSERQIAHFRPELCRPRVVVYSASSCLRSMTGSRSFHICIPEPNRALFSSRRQGKMGQRSWCKGSRAPEQTAGGKRTERGREKLTLCGALPALGIPNARQMSSYTSKFFNAAPVPAPSTLSTSSISAGPTTAFTPGSVPPPPSPTVAFPAPCTSPCAGAASPSPNPNPATFEPSTGMFQPTYWDVWCRSRTSGLVRARAKEGPEAAKMACMERWRARGSGWGEKGSKSG